MKNNGKRWLALLLSLLMITQSCFVSTELTRNVFAEGAGEGVVSVVEETPAEEAPAEETPAEEAPAEETPAEEA
ncbi:MAG: hypothetical protein J6Z24_05335, partial [Oscillospiraceae bacterium]|nr:hypothetical protein [Oscillospiraceae bacterium]